MWPNLKVPNVGFEVITAVIMKRSTFWDITPCRPLNFPLLVSCLAYSSTLKMKETRESETWVDIQPTTRHDVICQKIELLKSQS
jgi:hypothetical protein